MTLSVTVRVDRATAILAGKTLFGEQIAQITDDDLAEMTTEERGTLADLAATNMIGGAISLANFNIGSLARANGLSYPKFTSPDVDAVKSILHFARELKRLDEAEKVAQAERAAVEFDTKQRQWLSEPEVDHLIMGGPGSQREWCVRGPFRIIAPHEPIDRVSDGWLPEVRERVAHLMGLAKSRNEEKRERDAAVAKARQEAEEAAAKRAAAALDSCIRAHGTEGQRRRHDRGLLPNEELMAVYRDHVFAPLDAFPRYERINREDVQAAEANAYEDEYERLEFGVDDTTEATDEEFSTLEAIETVAKSALPEGAVCVLREHHGGLKAADHWAVHRKSVMVTIQEPVKVSREFACP